MLNIVLAFLCVWLALPAYAEATGLTVSNPQTDSNGVIWYDATSSYNGPGSSSLRVLQPTNPAPGVPHRFIYVLPHRQGVDLQDEFGDGLEELRLLNVHNDYNAHIVAPSFQVEPWYAEHVSNPDRRYESFMVNDLVPWVQANLSVTGAEEHWIIGFSKSGFGAVTLLFRNPTVFAAAAAWDFPADQMNAFDFSMLDNYGTDANFQNNYRLTNDWIAARKEPFQTSTRLWLSSDHVTYFGIPTFREEVLAFAQRLDANGVQYLLAGGANRIHSWTSGWLLEAVAGLHAGAPPSDPNPPPHVSSAGDDFNRADGGLEPDWLRDSAWGNGTGIAGGAVRSPLGNGGAHYWAANSFAADQYSQVTLTGAIGDWAGVVVRGKISPPQGYWAAVKADGLYLYARVNGVFYELVHDATPWVTGDVLSLAVQTIATNTARLTVYRNGNPLFTYDDAEHFIESGQPGIGLFASTAVALDDWAGGELTGDLPPPSSPTPPPHVSNAGDDFNRADGVLEPNWLRDPAWGSGTAIVGGSVEAPLFGGGAHYWATNSFVADQYSQVTLTGAIGDWAGVVVRAKVSPAQGYWTAVKGDGLYLYALVNGVFHELVHDATPWATGDVLSLAVQTIATTTARLTVYQNENVLFTHDDAEHFIESGQPGIGLYASTAVRLDDWAGGELTGDLPPPSSPTPPPHVSSAGDDFNRADGALGLDWETDLAWGSGTLIVGGVVESPLGNGGAHYWAANSFVADQYSQVTLTGAIGDWVGVVVRGKVSPAQGYWAAVKADGLHLYALVNGVFHELVHSVTPWATGDVLRLTVETIATNAARLTVYQNGNVLFTYDDAAHFIESGQPGIGLHASTAVALDEWIGGELTPGQ